jgi:acetyl esterase/lipase
MSQQPNQVELREGVVVGTTGQRDLLADVYVPPATTHTGVGLLLIHGGAWYLGDRAQLRGYGFLVGRRGVTVVSPDYRLVPEGVWPAPLHDVKAALRWMRAHADDLGIDPDRIAVAGASSGGHLALLLAGTAGDLASEGEGGHADAGTSVAATIALYAPSELAPGADMLRDSVEGLLGDDADTATYAQASPVSHVRPDWGPVMLMHSNTDDIVPVAQTLLLHDALREAGVHVEVHLFEGDPPHAYDMEPALGRLNADLIVSFLGRVCPGGDS